MNYYTGVLKKYAVFGGRARRKEFWMFVLFNIIIGVVLGMLDGKNNLIGNIYSLAVLIPSLAVGARRLHDINKSGWWQLLGLIPVIGWIWLIVLMCFDGDAADNRFGPNPKIIAVTPQISQ